MNSDEMPVRQVFHPDGPSASLDSDPRLVLPEVTLESFDIQDAASGVGEYRPPVIRARSIIGDNHVVPAGTHEDSVYVPPSLRRDTAGGAEDDFDSMFATHSAPVSVLPVDTDSDSWRTYDDQLPPDALAGIEVSERDFGEGGFDGNDIDLAESHRLADERRHLEGAAKSAAVREGKRGGRQKVKTDKAKDRAAKKIADEQARREAEEKRALEEAEKTRARLEAEHKRILVKNAADAARAAQKAQKASERKRGRKRGRQDDDSPAPAIVSLAVGSSAADVLATSPSEPSDATTTADKKQRRVDQKRIKQGEALAEQHAREMRRQEEKRLRQEANDAKRAAKDAEKRRKAEEKDAARAARKGRLKGAPRAPRGAKRTAAESGQSHAPQSPLLNDDTAISSTWFTPTSAVSAAEISPSSSERPGQEFLPDPSAPEPTPVWDAVEATPGNPVGDLQLPEFLSGQHQPTAADVEVIASTDHDDESVAGTRRERRLRMKLTEEEQHILTEAEHRAAMIALSNDITNAQIAEATDRYRQSREAIDAAAKVRDIEMSDRGVVTTPKERKKYRQRAVAAIVIGALVGVGLGIWQAENIKGLFAAAPGASLEQVPQIATASGAVLRIQTSSVTEQCGVVAVIQALGPTDDKPLELSSLQYEVNAGSADAQTATLAPSSSSCQFAKVVEPGTTGSYLVGLDVSAGDVGFASGGWSVTITDPSVNQYTTWTSGESSPSVTPDAAPTDGD